MDVRTWRGPPRTREPGSGPSRAAAWIGGLAAALVAVTGAAGLFLVLAPPSYHAEAQVLIGARTFGLIGLRAHLASSDREASALSVTKGQAQLVASRDLARRAIEDLAIDTRPEFDSDAQGRGPASRLLVLLGLKRDPDRMSRPERILQAYEDRLSVNAEPKSRLITIAFESQDRDLAAKAANRIADLYLEMRVQTKDSGLGVPEARIVSRAVSPLQPVFPRAWTVAFGLSATFAATAVGSLVASRRLRARRRDWPDEPVEQPVSLGPTCVPALTGENGRTSPLRTEGGRCGKGASEGMHGIDAIAQYILSTRQDTSGTIVLITSCAEVRESVRFTLDLARRLGRDARPILIGLDKGQRLELALPRPPDLPTRGGDPQPGTIRMTDLVEGRVSFGEVIRRDPSSRLHYVAADSDSDVTGSESVLEALAETYDFVVLVAPPLDRDDVAMTLAATADLVVLTTPPQPNDVATRKAEATLLGRGAREVRTVGLPSHLRRSVASSLGRDAA